MLDRIGKWSEVGFLRRLGREFHQLVVFVEGQRDVAGIRQRQRGFLLRRPHRRYTREGEKQDHKYVLQQYVFHRTPAFLSRWKLNSAAGDWFSLVSSETRNIDGPNAGKATLMGRMPVTFPASDFALKVSRRAWVASFFSLSSLLSGLAN